MTTPIDQNGGAGLAPKGLRTPLVVAAQSASTSYRVMLPPEMLEQALRTCVIPIAFEPHIGTLLEEAPLTMLGRVASQISAETALSADQIWSNMRELATQLKIERDISVPALLMAVQAIDEADVAAGRRSPRSLMAVQPGYLDGYTFTPGPNSEFDKPGEGW